jgi:hypothetical protein
MYTWGYLKENTLNKLNLSEDEANQQDFLSRFPYYANEAMTQICSAIRPKETFAELVVSKENDNIGKPLPISDELFISFSDDVVKHRVNRYSDWGEVGDEFIEYYGYNEIICNHEGIYRIPYKARWFFFTKDTQNDTVIPAPADVLDAIPSYIASQCYKIDDEVKAAIYRNEFEMFLARIDDTSFKSQRTFHIGGGW